MSGDARLPRPVLGGYPAETPWPTEAFERADAPEGLHVLLDQAFDDEGPLASTHAVVVVHRGRMVAERYGGELGSFVGDPTPVTPTTPLLSWSMAKSMLAMLVGQLVDEGRLDLDEPMATRVPEWSAEGDPRGEISLKDLLEMRDGLDFAEDYVDNRASDVIEMLFGTGQADMAHFAADRPLAAAPGSRFNYSSGTTNILSRLVAEELGGEAAMRAALDERLFLPLSMRTATPSFDQAGTFIASSYVHATAEDFARFGLMLCRGGRADGRQLVPEAWIDRQRTAVSVDEEDGSLYAAHLWVVGDELGSFYCNGFEGQRIVAVPPLDLVIVRLGSTPAERNADLAAWRDAIIDCFRPLG